MTEPADVRGTENGAAEIPDDSSVDLASSSTVVGLETLQMLEAFSVELVEPGDANPGLIEQLGRLRERTCLSRATYAIAEHCEHRPVFLGWLNDDDGQRPVVALYLAPSTEWVVRRRDLIQAAKKTTVPLDRAKFVNLLDIDCEPGALEHRLSWRLLRDSLKAVKERCATSVRTITYSTCPGLQEFLGGLVGTDQASNSMFWHVMVQTSERAEYGSLGAMAAELGNLVALAHELSDASAADLGVLAEEHGEALDGYLQALAQVYATELFDTKTGHHLCTVSRFHHYHGGKLVKTAARGDLADAATLGVVMHFEYNHDRMVARRDRYRQLRQLRRAPAEQQAAAKETSS